MGNIYTGSLFSISSTGGKYVREGTLASGNAGPGGTITITINQTTATYNSVYLQVVPLNGQTADFWDTFWSNKVGGEPADQFALSAFVNALGGSTSFTLNADSIAETRFESFAIRIYNSPTDPGFGRPPLAEGTFFIVDDDAQQFSRGGSVLVRDYAVGAGGWSSQDLYPRHVADMNGDGYGDIVGFGQAGVLVSYGSASGTFANAAVVVANFGQDAGWSSDARFHRELADVNGDGRADIIGFGQDGTLVALAKAGGGFGGTALTATDFGFAQGWSSQDRYARTVGDVNGDGKADLIVFGQDGTLVALGNGDGSFKAPLLGIANFGVAQGWSSDNAFHRATADVNGDGRADIVGFGQSGVLVALGQANGTFAAAQLALSAFGSAQGWSSQDATPRLVADVNHDGRADIVAFGSTGTAIAYGLADGTFTDPVNDVGEFSQAQGWTSDAIFHHEIADLNHDGLVDLIGFGQSGVLAAMNQGIPVF